MRRWTMYDLATGRLTGRTVLSDMEPAVSAGFGILPLKDGQTLRADVRRVNLSTGEIEPIQPPAPESDELRTWEWDQGAERWTEAPTAEAFKRIAAASLVRQIEAEEVLQSRALREVVLALAAGRAPPPRSLEALSLVDERIAPLRVQIQEATRKG